MSPTSSIPTLRLQDVVLLGLWEVRPVQHPIMVTRYSFRPGFSSLTSLPMKPLSLFNLPCQIRPESELTAMSGGWVGPHCTCFKSLLEGLFYVVLCCIRPLLVCLSNGLPSGPSPLFPSCLHPACGYTFLALCSFPFTQVVCKLF